VVEHRRRIEERLGEQERPARIAGEQDAGSQRRGRVDMERHGAARLDCRHAETAAQARAGRDAVSAFRSAAEFREVIDKTFTLMSDDPEMGPRLRDADTPQRFEFTDLDLVVNIRAGSAGEPNLVWEWDDEVAWEPAVRMTMSSETANRYFQGKENVAIAIARRRIKTGGDVKAALALIPVTKPLYARYRAMVETDYPHLVV
jgi:hypothetical protein